MKKIFLSILLIFTGVTAKTMDEQTKNNIKMSAFDSFDDGFDDNYSEDNFESEDNYSQKTQNAITKPAPGGNWIPTSAYFTIQMVNGIAGAQTVELFNALNSVSSVVNTSQFSGFNPFTAVNRAAANLNSVIYFEADGDLVIQSAAGTLLTISCKEIPYRTLLEACKFYRLKVKNIRMTFVADAQLDNGITYTERTIFGKDNKNSLTPRNYFKDDQFQSKQVTLTENLILDGERGLFFTVNQSETVTMLFRLSHYAKF